MTGSREARSSSLRQLAGNSLPGIGFDHDAPLGKRGGTHQTGGDGAECRLRQSHARLVDAVEQMYERSYAMPGHGLCPTQRGLDGGQQSTVPMVFQDAPAAFDRIVLAVVRRIVSQFQRQLISVREFDQSLHELRAGTGDLRAVVQIDQQPAHAGVRRPAVTPPHFQSIGHKVARVA